MTTNTGASSEDNPFMFPPRLPPFPAVRSLTRTAEQTAKAVTRAVNRASVDVADTFDRAAQKAQPPGFVLDTESQKADGKATVVDAETGESRPYDPARDTDVVFFQNGVLTTEAGANENGMALSRKTGKKVVVVYNARQGGPLDALQTGLDKVDPFGLIHQNPATDTEAEAMYQSASSGKPTHFVAHSQGAIIDRDALIRTHARLYREKYGESLARTHDPIRAHLEASRYADEKIQNVHIVAAGGAAVAWPPYANVDHVNNVADPVPNLLGQNTLGDPREALRELTGLDAPALDLLPGQGQRDRTDVINEPVVTDGFPGHSFEAVYCDDVAKKVG